MELKPCPFCGGEARFVNNTGWVVCCSCHAESAFFDSKEEATEAWNRRVGEGEKNGNQENL